jgi:pSer/pThr/pTyr-binding forkhead associated (FHA) protein
MKYAISQIKGKESYRIDDSSTLADAGIMCGDILSLTSEGIASPQWDTPSSAQPRAYVQFSNGELFKLNTHGETRLGRWSPNNDVDIDLTRFDTKKLVSRLHARIERRADGNYYLIDNHSTNGTHLNEKRLAIDTPHVLRTGDKIAFGTLQSGVQITFVIK